MIRSTRFAATFAAAITVAGAIGPAKASAQDDAFHLELTYRSTYRPGIVVIDSPGSDQLAQVAQIIRNDLDLSDRFDIMSLGGDGHDLAALDEAGVVWAVTIEEMGARQVNVKLVDVTYGQIKDGATFTLPKQNHSSWRMAIHAISDELVRWATGEQGIAATRIAFSMGGGSAEIYTVDYDGENLQRITDSNTLSLSPAWSADASRLAYATYRDEGSAIYVYDLRAGTDRPVVTGDGTNSTPTFSSSDVLAYAGSPQGRTSIHMLENDAVRALTSGRYQDAVSPSFAPDGARLVYVSNRMGNPHLYVRDLTTGRDELLSGFALRGSAYLQAPDWSPDGKRIAFHMRINGQMQVADVGVDGLGVRLLTDSGRNEDPSWAPDSRHLVFTSDRDGGGLFVLDVVTGRTRKLVSGQARLADWSAPIMKATY